MRISDWSSDVCSSDLPAQALERHLDVARAQFNLIVEIAELPLLPHLGGAPLAAFATDAHRSEERRVGKECVSTCSSRWSLYHYKKKHNIQQAVSTNESINPLTINQLTQTFSNI